MKLRIKKTRGKTWAKLQHDDFVDDKFLNEVGKLLVDSIIYEAAKDFAKQGHGPTPRGQPEGLPRSVKFFDSFGYTVKGDSVEIYSTWPFIERMVATRGENGKDPGPYRMTWLTQEAGVPVAKMTDEDGKVIFRTTPMFKRDAWIHPGFERYTFVRRGYERARRQMDKLIDKRVSQVLEETPIV